jgi:hypothetical protein
MISRQKEGRNMPANAGQTPRSERFDTGRPTWRDAWLSPGAELLVGIVLFVLSWEWFWETAGGVWETWHKVVGTIATPLSWYFIYRAWERHGGAAKATDV